MDYWEMVILCPFRPSTFTRHLVNTLEVCIFTKCKILQIRPSAPYHYSSYANNQIVKKKKIPEIHSVKSSFKSGII